MLKAPSTKPRPAHAGVRTHAAERPEYQAFQDRWDALSEVMWAAMVVAIAGRTTTSRLHAITCPTLVMVGETDAPFRGPSQAMADAIPHAELVVIPDAGHSPQFEAPDAWIDALQSFLGALVVTGS